jgi:hypothetical protein
MAEEAQKHLVGKDKASIRFKDAVGRKFNFPFHLCAKWLGMEDLIKQAFAHIEDLNPHVQAGHYDLVGPDGEIILPSIWERVIEPDWAITMLMWPMTQPRATPSRLPHGRPSGGPPLPPWVRPGHPLPPPPLSLSRHGAQGSVHEPSKAGPRRKSTKGHGILDSFFHSTALTRGHVSMKPEKPQVFRPLVSFPVARPKAKAPSTISSKTASTREPQPDQSSVQGDSDQVDTEEPSDDELNARRVAMEKDIIVTCKRSKSSDSQFHPPRRQTVLPAGKTTPAMPRKLDIASARVYWEDPLILSSASLELVRRRSTPPTTSTKQAQTGPGSMTWL